MDRAEFIEALHLIEKEKGIDKEIILKPLKHLWFPLAKELWF